MPSIADKQHRALRLSCCVPITVLYVGGVDCFTETRPSNCGLNHPTMPVNGTAELGGVPSPSAAIGPQRELSRAGIL